MSEAAGWRGWIAVRPSTVRAAAIAGVVALSLQASAATTDQVRTNIEKLNPGVRVRAPAATPVDALYSTTLDGTAGYVTADGRYFIAGDMYDVKTRRNLSEENRRTARAQIVGRITPEDAIVFAPEHPRRVITVFTDVDCGFCRKLHSDIAKYNALGIGVRYVAYPRSGPNTESWAAMEAVWCASDRRDALTRAKRGEKIQPASCASPIAEQYELGQEAGVQGTPLILLDDGRAIDGYLSPEQLARRLSLEPVRQEQSLMSSRIHNVAKSAPSGRVSR